LLAEGTSAPAAEEVSLGGLTVMPGAIDVHLHLGHGADISRPRVPGDAAQESAGAVAGGITCFIPYLMATDPFERVLPDVIAVTEAGSPDLQDLHEQQGRGGEAARPARYR
jgi:dihydropyrimidinase